MMNPGTTPEDSKMRVAVSSALSAVSAPTRGQPITAEDAEKAGSLTHTPRPHDETWNDARWRQDTSVWALIGSMSFSPQLCALCGRDRLSFAT
jgi:hypothetical protein